MTGSPTPDQVGVAFATRLAAKDTEALVALFRPDVDFRGMTPGRFWEAGSAQSVVDDVLYQWLEPGDIVESVEEVAAEPVVDRWRVDYRFRVRNDDGLFSVEQRAYFDVDDDGRITKMNAVCSGFRPIGD
jgi:hypothetical protein